MNDMRNAGGMEEKKDMAKEKKVMDEHQTSCHLFLSFEKHNRAAFPSLYVYARECCTQYLSVMQLLK